MHWRRKHSRYWISFQTNKEKIFQSWNENLINVSRSSYKCTFWETLQNYPSRVLLTRPLQSRKSVDKSPKNIFCGCFGTDMLFFFQQICYSPNWILFMALQRPTFNSQIHTSLHSRNTGICVFHSHLMQFWRWDTQLYIVTRPFCRLLSL